MPKKMVQEDSEVAQPTVDVEALKRDVLAAVLGELEQMVRWGDEKYNEGMRAAQDVVRKRLG